MPDDNEAQRKSREAVAWFRDKAIPAPREEGVQAIIETLSRTGIDITPEQALNVWEAASQAADHAWLNAFSCINPSDQFAADVGRTVISKVMAAPNHNVVLRINAS